MPHLVGYPIPSHFGIGHPRLGKAYTYMHEKDSQFKYRNYGVQILFAESVTLVLQDADALITKRVEPSQVRHFHVASVFASLRVEF